MRRRLALAICAILLLFAFPPPTAPSTPLVSTANAYSDGAGLDCNGWLGSPSAAPITPNRICADPINPATGQHILDNGWYIGHDEPSMRFLSFSPGSANNMQYSLTLPAVDPTPKQDGSQTANFENYVAFWFSLSICDPNSYPFGACTPNSDSNNPSSAGSALLELQFYPPGWEPFNGQTSCNHTQWCAALNIDSFTNTNGCIEPVNFAFIQKDGIPPGPPGPGSQTAATFTPNANTLLMNPGDNITVTIKDNGAALETDVHDLTTATTGFMVASSANGFKNVAQVTCAVAPFTFRPEYSTADVSHITPWTALFANVNFAMEIGHFELTAVGQTVGDGGDLDDTNCFAGPNNLASATSVPGCMSENNGGELDYDGTAYLADWADGTAVHPSSFLLGAPLSSSGGPYNSPFPSLQFATDGPGSEQTAKGSATTCNTSTGAGCVLPPQNAGGSVFYPFFSANSACQFLFGNDVSGQTTNDYGKVAQYGTPNPSYKGTFTGAVLNTPTCAAATTTTVTSTTTQTVTSVSTLTTASTTTTVTSTVTSTTISPTTTTLTSTVTSTTSVPTTVTSTVTTPTTTTQTTTTTSTVTSPTTTTQTVTSTLTFPTTTTATSTVTTPTTTTLTETSTSTVSIPVTTTTTVSVTSTLTSTATSTTTQTQTATSTVTSTQTTTATVTTPTTTTATLTSTQTTTLTSTTTAPTTVTSTVTSPTTLTSTQTTTQTSTLTTTSTETSTITSPTTSTQTITTTFTTQTTTTITSTATSTQTSTIASPTTTTLTSTLTSPTTTTQTLTSTQTTTLTTPTTTTLTTTQTTTLTTPTTSTVTSTDTTTLTSPTTTTQTLTSTQTTTLTTPTTTTVTSTETSTLTSPTTTTVTSTTTSPTTTTQTTTETVTSPTTTTLTSTFTSPTTTTVTSTVTTTSPTTTTLTTTQTTTMTSPTTATVTSTTTSPTTTTLTITSTQTTTSPITTTLTSTVTSQTTITATTTETATQTSTITSPTTTTVTSTQTTTSPTTTTVTSTITATVTSTATIVSTTVPGILPIVSLACAPSTVKLGDSTGCQATVSAAGATQLTGSVAFSSSGAGSFAKIKCGTSGEGGDNKANANDGGYAGPMRCSSRFSPAAMGGQTITATYSGDSHYSSNTGTFQLTVVNAGGDKPDGGAPLAGLLSPLQGISFASTASPFFAPSAFALVPSLFGLGILWSRKTLETTPG